MYQMIRVNTLRQRQNGRHLADNILKWIFLNENVANAIKISLKFVPKVPNDNNPALSHIMGCRQTGDKPLSEPMMALLTDAYICIPQPRWVNTLPYVSQYYIASLGTVDIHNIIASVIFILVVFRHSWQCLGGQIITLSGPSHHTLRKR